METTEALLRVLALAPRFGEAGGPGAVAAAVCREACEAFGADAALLVRRVGDEHVVYEAREPPSVLTPPGRTVLVADVPGLEDALGPAGTAVAYVGDSLRVPVVIEGRTERLLVLDLQPGARRFGPDEMLVLQRFVDHAALAIEHAARRRAEEEARLNTRQTDRLLSLGASLAATRTVDEVAEALVAEAMAQVGAGAAAVHALEGGRFVAVAGGRPPAEDVGGLLLRDEIVLLASSASVPLTAGAAVVGAIELRFDGVRDFDAADRQFLAALGRHGGLALERARLHADEVRAREEAELRASAAEALEHVAEGVFLVDGDGVVRVWNPVTSSVTGMPAAAVVGRRLEHVLPAWSSYLARAPVAVAGDAAAPVTLPYEAPHGELWLSISGLRFDQGTVYAFRDVTGDHALERLKSDFIATISHELRTPLAVLYGGALTLARDEAALSVDDRGRVLQMMAAEGRRLERLVDRILFASSLESDSAWAEASLVDAAALVRELAAETPGGSERIELDVPAAVEERRVRGDRDHLRQVMSNLVENALKYSPPDAPVTVSLSAPPSRLRIAVADRGPGIADADRDHVFEKFYRADSQLTRGVRGTGLGLYIVRELVTRIGGRVWAEPRDGGGAVFVVDLPAEPAVA
ncbi:MAG TPA: ATP-binding protein [Gaiellaceae bacterium]